MSKIKEYALANNGVVISSVQAAKVHLGVKDIIVYDGDDQEGFRESVRGYCKKEMSKTGFACPYAEFDFGSETVVYSRITRLVDRVSPPQQEQPVGTTVDPDALTEEAEEAAEAPEAPKTDAGENQSDTEDKTSWF